MQGRLQRVALPAVLELQKIPSTPSTPDETLFIQLARFGRHELDSSELRFCFFRLPNRDCKASPPRSQFASTRCHFRGLYRRRAGGKVAPVGGRYIMLAVCQAPDRATPASVVDLVNATCGIWGHLSRTRWSATGTCLRRRRGPRSAAPLAALATSAHIARVCHMHTAHLAGLATSAHIARVCHMHTAHAHSASAGGGHQLHSSLCLLVARCYTRCSARCLSHPRGVDSHRTSMRPKRRRPTASPPRTPASRAPRAACSTSMRWPRVFLGSWATSSLAAGQFASTRRASPYAGASRAASCSTWTHRQTSTKCRCSPG